MYFKLCYVKRNGEEITVMEEDLRICMVRPLNEIERRWTITKQVLLTKEYNLLYFNYTSKIYRVGGQFIVDFPLLMIPGYICTFLILELRVYDCYFKILIILITFIFLYNNLLISGSALKWFHLLKVMFYRYFIFT